MSVEGFSDVSPWGSMGRALGDRGSVHGVAHVPLLAQLVHELHDVERLAVGHLAQLAANEITARLE